MLIVVVWLTHDEIVVTDKVFDLFLIHLKLSNMSDSIVLHWKVGAAALVEDVVRRWLLRPANRSVSGFVTVAELFLLHVLLPLGRTNAALELIHGDVGGSAFNEEQRRAALELVEETQQRREDPPPEPRADPDPVSSEGLTQTQEGFSLFSLRKRTRIWLFLSLCLRACAAESGVRSSLSLQEVVADLLWILSSAQTPAGVSSSLPAGSASGSRSVRFLWVSIRSEGSFLYFINQFLPLFVPSALPSAYIFISKLLQLLRGVWTAMFAPYYQAVTARKRLWGVKTVRSKDWGSSNFTNRDILLSQTRFLIWIRGNWTLKTLVLRSNWVWEINSVITKWKLTWSQKILVWGQESVQQLFEVEKDDDDDEDQVVASLVANSD